MRKLDQRGVQWRPCVCPTHTLMSETSGTASLKGQFQSHLLRSYLSFALLRMV